MNYEQEKSFQIYQPSLPNGAYEKTVAVSGEWSDNVIDVYADYGDKIAHQFRQDCGPFFFQKCSKDGETLPGAQNLGETDDAAYFRNKLFAALDFPKSCK